MRGSVTAPVHFPKSGSEMSVLNADWPLVMSPPPRVVNMSLVLVNQLEPVARFH